MRVSIHQPDFLPWLGFFNKVANSDAFVIFDHVQAPQGKSWLTRNRIPLNGSVRWLTIPIKRDGLKAIDEVVIDTSQNYRRKHIGTIKQSYKKAAFFDEVFPLINDIYEYESCNLSDFNQNAIVKLCKRMEVDVTLLKSSEIIAQFPEIQKLRGNDLVLGLCQAVGATFYISGTGCLDFIQPETFKKQGITFMFQDFKHQEYMQIHNGDFIPSMSIIDALFNTGFLKTAESIKREMLQTPEALYKGQ